MILGRVAISIVFLFCIAKAPAQSLGIYRLPPFERGVACIKYFEGLHQVKDFPYVGYGHRIQSGEHFNLPLDKRQAEALLRQDLRKLCRMFRAYGRDSLLLSVLAYNVGYGTVMGHGKKGKSRLIQKIERGDRDIYYDYIGFCRYNDKVIPSIRKRRKIELSLLFVK